jgi:hypothetical protein
VSNKLEMPNFNKVPSFKGTTCSFDKNHTSFNENHTPFEIVATLKFQCPNFAVISDSNSIKKLGIFVNNLIFYEGELQLTSITQVSPLAVETKQSQWFLKVGLIFQSGFKNLLQSWVKCQCFLQVRLIS